MTATTYMDRERLTAITTAAGLEIGHDVLDNFRCGDHHVVAVCGMQTLIDFLGEAARQLDADHYADLFAAADIGPTLVFFPHTHVLDG